MDCGFLAMLWRIWMLLVSFLRRMTVRPNVLLPMAVKDAGAGRKGEIGNGKGSSTWKDQKAAFLRDPSLRRSKQLQQQRPHRRFFDFSLRPRQANTASSTTSQSKPTPTSASNNSNLYGKWRKKQPKTNAFIFVTPPPTVTVQDWSSTPLGPGLGLCLTDTNADATSTGNANANVSTPQRPPRPPSGPVPAVIVTPCTPLIPSGGESNPGGHGGLGLGLRRGDLPSALGRDQDRGRERHHRRSRSGSGSGRHLSPDWFGKSSAGQGNSVVSPGHGRGSVHVPVPEPNDGLLNVTETGTLFKSPAAIFPSSRVQIQGPASSSSASSASSISQVQYHQDVSLPWSDSTSTSNIIDNSISIDNSTSIDTNSILNNSSSPPAPECLAFNSRAASYITSTPAKIKSKNVKGLAVSTAVSASAGAFSSVGDQAQDVSLSVSFSEADSTPQFQARRVHLPHSHPNTNTSDQLDLLPYPDVFDLDMYFSARNSNSSANCIPTSAHRLSLCVLRNAKLEDIQQMQELQSRQSLSLSLSGEVESGDLDLMGLYGSGSEFSRLPSSPPRLQPQHQSQLLGRMALGDVDEERENWATAPARTVASTSRATKAKRFGYVPDDPDLSPRPAAHGHSHTRSTSTVGTRIQQELELEEGRGRGREVRRLQPSASRPILRQVGNILPVPANAKYPTSAAAASNSTPTNTPTSTVRSRVLVPQSSHSRSHPSSQLQVSTSPILPPATISSGTGTITTTASSSPSSLQIRVPGLSGRVVNRTKESDLSPIKEAFHPPSCAVLSPTSIPPELPCPKRRPPTVPVVIVSHHRFGSMSDYGDGNEDGENRDKYEEYDGDSAARCYLAGSSSDEDEDEDEERGYVKHFKSRTPGYGHDTGKDKRRRRRSGWMTEGGGSYVCGDEESGLEVVSLN